MNTAATEFERRFHISVDESDNQSIQVRMNSMTPDGIFFPLKKRFLLGLQCKSWSLKSFFFV